MFICLVSAPFGTMTKFDEVGNEQDTSFEQEIPERTEYNLANMKGWFTENRGQIENSDVKYVYGASDLAIGFIESGYLIKLTNEENLTSVVKLTFEGSNRVMPVGRGELSHKSNYFRGNDSSKWRSGVPNYEKMVYENLYDGIDLVFYTNEKGLKYDFIVYPKIDPLQICWSYDGVDGISINDAGNLVIETPAGDIVEQAPYSYQFADREKAEIRSGYHIEGWTVSIETEDYEQTAALIIDPMIYSTFIGGDRLEEPGGIALDSDNNACVVGFTGSDDFPTTPGSYDTEFAGGSFDAFVCKFNTDASDLIFSTFIGGNSGDDGSDDQGLGIALDDEDNIYISGQTGSDDFPVTSGCYDDSHNGETDVFVCKLNSEGNDLIYSTYVGGGDIENGRAICLDSERNVYITGDTGSYDYPTTSGCYDSTHNNPVESSDVFVSKVNYYPLKGAASKC